MCCRARLADGKLLLGGAREEEDGQAAAVPQKGGAAQEQFRIPTQLRQRYVQARGGCSDVAWALQRLLCDQAAPLAAAWFLLAAAYPTK